MADIALYVHFHGYDASELLARWENRYAISQAFTSLLLDLFALPNFWRIILKEHVSGRKSFMLFLVVVDIDYLSPYFERDKHYFEPWGRFVEKKAPRHTLEAFSHVAREFPEIRLEMIGEGHLLPDCRSLVEKYGLTGRVIFHGARFSRICEEENAGG